VSTLAGTLLATLAHAQPQSFTYQGELRNGGGLAQGPHDLRFEMLDEGEGVLQILCADDVPVVDGRFTVLLDPGQEFSSLLREARAIRVLVRPDTGLSCDDTADFVALSPTQPFTRSPLATRAAVADRADTASSLAGFTPSYFTNAANLTGTIPDAALSNNVPRLGASNSFSDNTPLGSTNTFDNLDVRGWLGSASGSVQLRANGQRAMLIQQDFGAPRITMGSPSNLVVSGAAGANILGGEGNRVDSTFGTIAGGSNNVLGTFGPGVVGGQYSTIGGGRSNEIQAGHAAIAGGFLNRALSEFAAVGGGERNEALARHATIAGGGPSDSGDVFNTNNRVHDAFGTIGGGGNNRAGDNLGSADDRPFATVGGGRDNRATSEFSTVGGGSGNRAQTQFATVGGGVNNTAGGGGFSTVAGGSANAATGFVATVAGGDFNNASGERSAIGGGNGNAASARFSTVAGGLGNTASGEAAAVGGGASNLATAAYAVVPGGVNNQASGFASLAAGWGARAAHDGALVFADASQSGSPLLSTGPNQLTVRASGGMRFLGTGNAPRLTIDTAGTVSVPGTLSAGSVSYAAPVTRFRAYPAGAFTGSVRLPVRAGTWEQLVTGDGDTVNGDGFSRLHLALDLPDGAVITGVRFTIRDTDLNRWMDLNLVRTSLNDGSANSIASALTQAFFGDGIPVDLPIAPPIVVDNANSTLEILVEPKTNGAFGPFPTWSGNIGIYGVRVQYTVASPAP
jgi:hypothetical protein